MAEFDDDAMPFRTVPQLVDWAAATFGDAAFIVDEDGAAIGFREAKALAERAARGFIAAGVEPGDRVAVWAPNGPEWIAAALGLQLAGAVLVPLNTRFRGGEAAFILKTARAGALCTVDGFLGADYLGMLRGACEGAGRDGPVEGLPAMRTVVFLDGARREGGVAWDDFLAAGDALQPDLLDRRREAIGPDTPCDILFTSGTTGAPKGAVHSHVQALKMPMKWNAVNGFEPGDRMLIVNPFFHSFGYRAGWMSCLCAGMTAYPVAVFDVDKALRLIEAEKITVLPGPPALFQAILDHPDRARFDLSSLRAGHTGSANLDPEVVRRARDELGFEVFLTSYGMTEATAMATTCRLGDDIATIAGTVGRPFPGVELKIAGPDGAALAPGEAGEVLLRGDNVMLGYFEDPEATAAAVDADGWLHTGDVGALDEAGNLRILDRLKDVVIVGGFNAYPAEIESMLREHPAVAEAAVIGIPDSRLGEACAAFVVLRPGAALDEAGLVAWSRERMANFKVPRRLFLTEALPKTPLGKVQKHVLRDEAKTSMEA